MSFSQCIKCEQMVGMYEKYCSDCVRKYGVRQDMDFWKRQADMSVSWNNRQLIFEQDMKAVPVFHVSKNVQPETLMALREAANAAMDTQSVSHKKKRKRSHGTKNVRAQ